MIKNISLALLLLTTVISYSQPVLWAKKGGGPNSEGGAGISTDYQGNSYVVGTFSVSAVFGTYTVTSSGGVETFIAKYSGAGNCLWAVSAGGTGNDYGRAISIDASGNSYITGTFNGTATLGTYSITSAGMDDIFIAKYNSNGVCQWAKQAGSNSNDWAYGISSDNAGNIFITGLFNNTCLFDAIPLTVYGSVDIYIAKYSTSGNCIWAKQAGGTGDEQGYAIASDNKGNCFVTGTYINGSAAFDTYTLTASPMGGGFVAKYNSAGNCKWAQKIAGPDSDLSKGVSSDTSGNCYVVGSFWTSISIGTFNLTSSGKEDAFIAKYDSVGTAKWARKTGGIEYSYAKSISTDPLGNSYVCGNFDSVMPIGTFTLTSSGNEDSFVAEYNSAGTCTWAKKISGTLYQNSCGISTDGKDSCYITGSVNGTTLFDTVNVVSSGNYDFFIAKIAGFPAPVSNFSVTATTICANTCINFTDLTTNNPATWSWSFPGGVPSSSSSQNPGSVCYYNTRGTYTATLTTTNFGGTSTYSKVITVTSKIFEWAKALGGDVSPPGQAAGASICLDTSNNLYISGNFDWDIAFPNDTLHALSNNEIFLAKYTSSGNYKWAIQPVKSGYVDTRNITCDNNGNIIFLGHFWGNINFSGFPAVNDPNSIHNIILAKFDSSGTCLWAKAPNNNGGQVYSYHVETDGLGNIYCSGQFWGKVSFDGITLISPNSKYNIFIAKFDPNGNCIWAKNIYGINDEGNENQIAVDKFGNSYITGDFEGNITFNNITLTTNPGNWEIFIARYDKNGNCLWAKKAGGNNSDRGYGIACDNFENVFVTGVFQGTANFSSYTIASNGQEDIFLAKYDTLGNCKWVKSFGGTSDEKGYRISVDNNGNCYTIGGFWSPYLQFDNFPPLVNRGSFDSFQAKFNQHGKCIWASSCGGTGDELTTDITSNSSGESYVIGSFRNEQKMYLENLTLTHSMLPYTPTTLNNLYFAKASILANAGPDFIFCGTSFPVQLNATGGINYSWAQTTGLNNPNISNPIANVSTTTSYTVTVTDVAGCPNSDEMSILISSANAGANVTICQGGATTLSASGGNTYQWFPSTSLSNPNISNPTATPTLTTTYYVNMTDTLGCNVVDSVNVFVDSCFVGVDEESGFIGIKIYPNPTAGHFAVQSSSIISNIEIANILGELVYCTRTNAGKSEIDLSNELNGVYFIRIKTGAGIVNKKIIINK